MSVLVDIILVCTIILGVFAGVKRGLIKTAVGLVGLFAAIMLSYSFRIPIANWMIDNLPFFDFSGDLAGLTTLNILIYNIIAFVIVFVLLYSILNIVISVTRFIDTLLNLTIIWIIPSKIGGAIIGFFETVAYLYIVLFILGSFSLTNNLIKDSSVSNFILDHTPVLEKYLSGARYATSNIYKSIDEAIIKKEKDVKELNLEILQFEISGKLITKEKAMELIETGKLTGMTGTILAVEDVNEWLSI